MHRAGQRQVTLRALKLVDVTPRQLVDALTADLAAVDSVIAEAERLQRQTRAPNQR
jgi:hypothetical protein